RYLCPSRPTHSPRTGHTATYTLSLHDALPIFLDQEKAYDRVNWDFMFRCLKELGVGLKFITAIQQLYSNAQSCVTTNGYTSQPRSEEHTSELQSRENLVCRLLLEKKKTEDTVE